MTRVPTKSKTVAPTCHAVNPDPGKHGLCGSELGHVNGPLRFVATATRRPEVREGRTHLQCPRRDCRTWNVFETLAE